jgi:hypothetical protein
LLRFLAAVELYQKPQLGLGSTRTSSPARVIFDAKILNAANPKRWIAVINKRARAP